MRDELSVVIQRKCGKRAPGVPRLFPASEMDIGKRNVPCLCSCLQKRHILCGKRTLRCISDVKAFSASHELRFTQERNRGFAAPSEKGRYHSSKYGSAESASRKPLYPRYFGSERKPFFFLDEITASPFFPFSRLSRIHSSKSSVEYP